MHRHKNFCDVDDATISNCTREHKRVQSTLIVFVIVRRSKQVKIENFHAKKLATADFSSEILNEIEVVKMRE